MIYYSRWLVPNLKNGFRCFLLRLIQGLTRIHVMIIRQKKIVSKNRCKPSVHIFVLFWSLTTLTVKFSQTKQLLSIYNVWKILWAGLKGSTQRKIMMLKSEMTFTNKLRSVGSRLRIFLSWLAGCFRFLLPSFLKVSYSEKEILLSSN